MSALRDLVVSIDFDDIDIANLTRIDTAMDEIEDQLSDMGKNIDDAASEFKTMGNSADGALGGIQDDARDAQRAVYGLEESSDKAGDALDDLKTDSDKAGDALDDLGKDGEDAMDEVKDGASDAAKKIDDLGKDGGDAMDEITDGASDAAKETNDLENELKQADSATGGLSGSMKKLIGIVAGFIAVDKIKDLGVSMIESAATAQAVSAQYEQVFDDMQGDATKTIEAMGKDFGMLPNRLKAPFTQTTSMFKGLGLDTEDAMEQAEKAVTLAADAAAFYDKSYEDANSSLGSFIKGNYEGGESIGLFANETQMAAWASDELGIEWKKLGEADKQMARLAFAESMQDAAGATGQAARESEGYENVMGNVGQAWEDLKATLGGALLEPAVNAIQGVTTAMQNFNPDPFVAFLESAVSIGGQAWDIMGGIKDTISAMVTGSGDISQIWVELGVPPEVAEGIEILAGIFETVLGGAIGIVKAGFSDFKGLLEWGIENYEVVGALLGGLGAALGTLLIINTISSGFNLLKGALLTSTPVTIAQTVATQGLNAAMRANPIGTVITLIGLLVSAGILLYQNWDTVKAKAFELWEGIKSAWGSLKEWSTGVFEGMKDGVLKAMGKLESGWNTVWDSIKGAAETAVNGVIGKINGLIETINKIPGVNVPLVAEVNYVETGADGSHATGLSRVPFDGYMAELHKDEAVLTARQSNALRAAGILDSKGSKPDVNVGGGEVRSTRGGGGSTFAPSITIQVNGANADEETIARRAAEAARREMERFWRKMSVAQ